MDSHTGEIREVTWDEPLRKGEISLTEQQALELEPMNRAERRAWVKQQRRKGSR